MMIELKFMVMMAGRPGNVVGRIYDLCKIKCNIP